jgi:adenylate cyclase
MTDLPIGTLTFLFSDIEGSTRLLKAQRDHYPALLAAHRTIVRDAVGAHGGQEVDTQGDAFFVVFTDATSAVHCALDVQRALQAHLWPEGANVCVRMGIHTGQASSSDVGFAGLSVHRAARICAVAAGGQVLVSQATQTILEDEEVELGFSLVNVGVRTLKDLDRPVQLFEVVEDGAASAGLAGAAADGRPMGGGGLDDTVRRIVVLPFANISPDPADEYFADGLTEELIEKLAHIDGLGVIARTTAMHYKGTTKTIREIGEALGVGLVLECSVRKAGDRLRVTAQLIETGSEEHLWASRYDRELDDIFAIQDDIAEQIAAATRSHLESAGKRADVGHAENARDTEDLEAYTEFLQARELLRTKRSEGSMRHALSLFERAVERDGRFARARVGVAECMAYLAAEGLLPPETSARILDELQSVLAIDDTVAEAHSALAGELVSLDDMAGALREARRAIELNPSFTDPYRWLAQCEASDGKVDEATRVLEHAYRLNPLDVDVIAFLGRLYFYAGRIDDAVAFWARTESLVEYRTRAHRAELLLSCGDLDAARHEIDEMARLRPQTPLPNAYRGILLAKLGDAEGARECIARIDNLEHGSPVATFLIGFVLYALGDLDGFFRCQNEALEQHFLPFLEILYSPLFDEARETPRFQALIARQYAQQSR